MSNIKSQSNIREIMIMANDFKFEDRDKQRTFDRMLIRVEGMIGGRSFEDLDEDVNFLGALLELIDLINQEHEQNRDSWWAEEFQVNFSEFEPKSVTPYCHGKYYCIVDEQGAYILNYKKEKITGYYDHIVNMVEEDGQLYLYSRIGLSYGVYTKEGTLILKDESNGSRGGFFFQGRGSIFCFSAAAWWWAQYCQFEYRTAIVC